MPKILLIFRLWASASFYFAEVIELLSENHVAFPAMILKSGDDLISGTQDAVVDGIDANRITTQLQKLLTRIDYGTASQERPDDESNI